MVGAGKCRLVSQVIGRWDEFQFLQAFHELDVLDRFAVDFWMPIGRWGMHRMVPEKMARKFERLGSSQIPSRYACIDPTAFLYMLALRSGWFDRHRQRLWRLQGEAIGRRTAALARRAQATAVFAYNYYAKWTFDDLPSSMVRLLHQVHPTAPYLRRLYLEEIERDEFLCQELRAELELTDDTLFYQALCEGPLMADHIVAASLFTKKTLITSGVASDKIDVVPYGADLTRFKPSDRMEVNRKPIVLFVGSVSARKGIGYLLRAWKMLKPASAELVIIGSLPQSKETLKQLRAFDVTYLGHVSDAELVVWFQKADFFCLPSIAEGFGLVLLQAMACGTPIIGTDATGAADIVAGFPDVGRVVPSRSAEALASGLEDCLTKVGEWRSRRNECVRAAGFYTWMHFREEVKRWFTRVGDRKGPS